MILVVVMWLDASVLEPCPFAIHIGILPLDLVQDVGWHAQNTGCPNVAMMIGLH